MRQPSGACISLIKRSELFMAAPYLCPAQVWTIAWGSTRDLDGNPVSPRTLSVTETEGEILLSREIAHAVGAVERLIVVPLTAGQFDALVDFAYNLGSGALQASTLRRKLNTGEYDAVPQELMHWIHGGGRKLPGLIRRRAAEADLWNA